MREETMWPPVARLKRPEKKRATGTRREEVEEEPPTILSASPSFFSRFLMTDKRLDWGQNNRVEKKLRCFVSTTRCSGMTSFL